jgi:multiple sugar transport system substrate-binding protein
MLRHKWIAAAVNVAVAVAPGSSVAQELTIFWAEWDPANYLQELVNEYPDAQITVETTPWADFQTKAFLEFTAQGDSYDMVVGDSQWLGAGSIGGHYVELTDFVREHNLTEVMAPATMTYFSEYPKGSGRYWAVPLEGDAMGWAYRKDWFEDPAEKEAFKANYGYELVVPKTWQELRDIAEFFQRPDANPPRYGVAIYTQVNADALAMGFENVLFSYGGDLGNYQTCEVQGIINSPQAVQALELYKELYSFTPPNWGNAGFQENNQAMIEGLAAISMNYFAVLPSLINPAVNPHAENTGFFVNPAGPGGKQFAALGGQGISIVSYSDKQEESKRFLEWFIQEDVQKRWAELGGYTTHAETLESPEFRSATPYNEAFYQSMFMVKDFWAVPFYAELIQELNNRLGPYVVHSEGSAQEALNALAADWEATIAQNGCT